MKFHSLGTRTSGAAENMAVDFLLLQRYPDSNDVRFRHYDWHRPAFTFGYSQKIAFVRNQLPLDSAVELCRRPTGGGVVDHRADWTYALVIPRGHPGYDIRAIESYRLVHACIAEALNEFGTPATLKERCEPNSDDAQCSTGVCFTRPELYDVIAPQTGTKLAGAAQKRTKHGLLFQGSIARGGTRPDFDWESYHQTFVEKLGAALQLTPEEHSWPEWQEDEISPLVEHYSSPEWNEFR